MSAEQTPDIERVLAEHEHVGPACTGGRGWHWACSCGEDLGDVDLVSPLVPVTDEAKQAHRAHVAQALAPVLAAAVREAAPTHAKLREAGWKTPDDLAAVRAEARRMVLALASEYRPMVDQGSGSYLNPRLVVARLEELADRDAEPQHEAATSGKESEASDE